jgi:hypothetical protein
MTAREAKGAFCCSAAPYDWSLSLTASLAAKFCVRDEVVIDSRDSGGESAKDRVLEIGGRGCYVVGLSRRASSIT